MKFTTSQEPGGGEEYIYMCTYTHIICAYGKTGINIQLKFP